MRRYTLRLISCVLVAIPVTATNFTFNPQQNNAGNWNDATNWTPPTQFPPDIDDTVTIEAGDTCVILGGTAEACSTLTIDSGGFLELGLLSDSQGAMLTIGDDDPQTPGVATINGTLKAVRSNCSIVIGQGHVFTGSGSILTRPASGQPGDTIGGKVIIFPYLQGEPAAAVQYTGTLKLIGSIYFQTTMSVASTVRFEASQPEHEMLFGPNANYEYQCDFSGTLEVTDGSATVQRMFFGSSNGIFDVAGGEIWLRKFPTVGTEFATMAATRIAFVVRGAGTLDDDVMLAGRSLDLKNTAKIEVAPGKTATFSP